MLDPSLYVHANCRIKAHSNSSSIARSTEYATFQTVLELAEKHHRLRAALDRPR
jgi:hypothetical protein